jgi:hypothetical protein
VEATGSATDGVASPRCRLFARRIGEGLAKSAGRDPLIPTPHHARHEEVGLPREVLGLVGHAYHVWRAMIEVRK